MIMITEGPLHLLERQSNHSTSCQMEKKQLTTSLVEGWDMGRERIYYTLGWIQSLSLSISLCDCWALAEECTLLNAILVLAAVGRTCHPNFSESTLLRVSSRYFTRLTKQELYASTLRSFSYGSDCGQAFKLAFQWHSTCHHPTSTGERKSFDVFAKCGWCSWSVRAQCNCATAHHFRYVSIQVSFNK